MMILALPCRSKAAQLGHVDLSPGAAIRRPKCTGGSVESFDSVRQLVCPYDRVENFLADPSCAVVWLSDTLPPPAVEAACSFALRP